MYGCVYPGCCNKRSKHNLQSKSFHTIPVLDAELRKLWLTALKIDLNISPEQTKNWYVCSDHFPLEDFYPRESSTEETTPNKRPGLRENKRKVIVRRECRRIRPTAVPTPSLEVIIYLIYRPCLEEFIEENGKKDQVQCHDSTAQIRWYKVN